MNVRNKLLCIGVLIVLAVVLLQGLWLPSTGQAFDSPLPTPQSGVEIQRISGKGSTITIYAQFYEPVEGYEQKAMVTSPYHLVKMQKG